MSVTKANASVYLALVHHPVVDREGKIITSAVTSIDLHDFSRLARTYGLGGIFVQTHLDQQRTLVEKLVEHWVEGVGGELNPDRKEALGGLYLAATVSDVIARIEEAHGAPVFTVATSARGDGERVEFSALRERMADETRPVLILFGTSWGLAPEVLAAVDAVLAPVGSPSGYNHLSVRSAASIIVDRLLGER